jgi:hypothetical protein
MVNYSEAGRQVIVFTQWSDRPVMAAQRREIVINAVDFHQNGTWLVPIGPRPTQDFQFVTPDIQRSRSKRGGSNMKVPLHATSNSTCIVSASRDDLYDAAAVLL